MEILGAIALLLTIILVVANALNKPAVRRFDVTAAGRALHARFFALGDLSGKTATEIIARVGAPTSRSSMANGQTLLQWQATGYHMALLFDAEGKAVKITHESAHFAA
jgi:hypothetical protein